MFRALRVIALDIFRDFCRDLLVIQLVRHGSSDAGNPRFVYGDVEFVIEHRGDLLRDQIVVGKRNDVRHAVRDGIFVRLRKHGDDLVRNRIFVDLRQRRGDLIRDHVVIGFGKHGHDLFRKHAVVDRFVVKRLLGIPAHRFANGAFLLLFLRLRNARNKRLHLFAKFFADLFRNGRDDRPNFFAHLFANLVGKRLRAHVQRFGQNDVRLFKLFAEEARHVFGALFESSVADVHLLGQIAVNLLHLQIDHAHIRSRVRLRRFELNVQKLGQRTVDPLELLVDGTHTALGFFVFLFFPLVERVVEFFVTLVRRLDHRLRAFAKRVDTRIQPFGQRAVDFFELLADRARKHIRLVLDRNVKRIDLTLDRVDHRGLRFSRRVPVSRIGNRLHQTFVCRNAFSLFVFVNRAVLLRDVMQLVDHGVETLFQGIHHRLVGVRLLLGAVLNFFIQRLFYVVDLPRDPFVHSFKNRGFLIIVIVCHSYLARICS